MARLGGLVKELDIWVCIVSHLTTPDMGKSHEEGGRVTIRQFKGSRAIGFWCHHMLALERDQQAEDIEQRQTTTLRVLKDRVTGQATGKTFKLGYDPVSGLSYPIENSGFGPVEDGSPLF
jgi:twinkle protein